MTHTLAAAIYDGLLAFEYSIAREILGLDRRQLTPNWYRFLPCRIEEGPLTSSHGLEIRPNGTLQDLEQADTVLIAGWRQPLERPPEPFLDALRRAHHRGARLVSICTGAFALAHAGLLDGRRATTHWLHSETLSHAFPEVQVKPDALYLHDIQDGHHIATSAGCAAGLDLCLALVRDDFGIKVANAIARRMVAPVHRDGGQCQYAEPPDDTSEGEALGAVLDWMIEHLDEDMVMLDIARRFGFSLRTFQRRFRDVTGNTPHQWLVQQRITRARELLESSNLSVERIADRCGLGTAVNLRKHLSRHLGTTPRAYRSAFRAA